MKRKTFIEIIAHIQAQQRRDSEISQLLGSITDETAVYITQQRWDGDMSSKSYSNGM